MVQGVWSELVSGGFPCYAGKIQGNFAIQADFSPLRSRYLTDKKSFFLQIPYSAEQGIKPAHQGINRESGGQNVSVRALHACFRLSGCDLLFAAYSVNEEGDRAKNDGWEALGTRLVLAGAFGRLAA